MPLKDGGIERKSAFSVRLFLKEFCVEFLHGAYNTFMKQVRVSIYHYMFNLLICLGFLFVLFFSGTAGAI